MSPNLLLTGPPRVGKTTLLRQALQSLPPGVACGFLTHELRQNGRRVGFVVETLAGESRLLAHIDIHSRYRVGRYGVDLAAFEALALPAIDPTVVSVPLIVIDEIGKMECFSGRFRELVMAVMASDRALLATIALHGDRFIEGLKLRPGVTLLPVTLENRDELVDRVVRWAQEVLVRD